MFLLLTSKGWRIEAIRTEDEKIQFAQLELQLQIHQEKNNPLENYLQSKHHGDFVKVAELIQKSCEKYNIPFEITLAIAILESGYGTSRIAQEKQNFFAIGAYDWNPYNSASDFSDLSLEEAIDYQILILKNDYFVRYKNLEEIAKNYCRNWRSWLEEVKFIAREVTEIFPKNVKYEQIK
ncbi:MAG: glucosaminidase domain-containing protein [Parcubacteria group bacterium]|nr:glucosaminidase domain-containing protein [Parcubacteria group bacterium]